MILKMWVTLAADKIVSISAASIVGVFCFLIDCWQADVIEVPLTREELLALAILGSTRGFPTAGC
jgi:hypothetical protein